MLVVIGIMALMIGAVGVALRGGGSGTALQSAQSVVASLCETARAQAAISNAPSAIAVESSGEGALRVLRVAVQVAGNWKFAGEPVSLSKECYLVPDAALPAGVALVDWPSARKSTFGSNTTVTDQAGNAVNCYLSLFRFSADGKFSSSGATDRLVVATARRSSPTELIFENPQFVRGVVLSVYGTAILVNEPDGF